MEHYLKLTVAHHNFQELDDNFGTGSYQNLTFTSLLSVVDGLESIAQYIHTHHLDS